MNCFFCRGELEDSTTTHVVALDECIIIVKNVPCTRCGQCGETFFDNEVAKHLEKIVETVKHDMENLCQKLGMNLTTVITVFFKKTVSEQDISFKASADSFYAESNQACIREAITRLNSGLGTEHELIEADK